MSFILDALKKSEAERQRQSGPTLLEVRVALPRRRYPIWALALGALLVVNAALLAWFVWLRPATPPEPAALATAVPPAATATPPAASAAPPANAATAALSSRSAPPVAAAARGVAAASVPPSAAPSGGPSASASGSVAADRGRGNPADFEPAVPPAAAAASAQSAASAGAAAAAQAASPADADARYAALPTLAELGGLVPPMHLDLLVHSADADQSYALIDMHKAHVGDELPEGATVVAITREGVVLDYRGRQFMLTPR